MLVCAVLPSGSRCLLLTRKLRPLATLWLRPLTAHVRAEAKSICSYGGFSWLCVPMLQAWCIRKRRLMCRAQVSLRAQGPEVAQLYGNNTIVATHTAQPLSFIESLPSNQFRVVYSMLHLARGIWHCTARVPPIRRRISRLTSQLISSHFDVTLRGGTATISCTQT